MVSRKTSLWNLKKKIIKNKNPLPEPRQTLKCSKREWNLWIFLFAQGTLSRLPISALSADWFERKRKDSRVISLLLEQGTDKSSFKSKEALAALLEDLQKKIKNIKPGEITFDEEQEAYAVEIKLQNSKMNLSVQFKEIAQVYKEVTAIFGKPPYKIAIKEIKKEAASLKELLATATEASRKGLSIQRYKGLGEMNPQQLWETTMDPEKRALLQVTIEDSVKADEIFTILMGDQVEPRKEFITKHALEAKNIDI